MCTSAPNTVLCNWPVSVLYNYNLIESKKFDYCDVFHPILFIQRDKQLVKKLNKHASKLSNAEDALFIRLVLIHLHMISAFSAIHPCLSSLIYNVSEQKRNGGDRVSSYYDQIS